MTSHRPWILNAVTTNRNIKSYLRAPFCLAPCHAAYETGYTCTCFRLKFVFDSFFLKAAATFKNICNKLNVDNEQAVVQFNLLSIKELQHPASERQIFAATRENKLNKQNHFLWFSTFQQNNSCVQFKNGLW